MGDSWRPGISAVIQVVADSKNNKVLYIIVKQNFGSITAYVTVFISKDGAHIIISF